jgi:large subunit ribosomal protein L28
VGFGNQISFSHKCSRRKWKPNVHCKTLQSELLGETFKINVTTAALRIIDKKGGLDRYILYTSDRKLDSLFATKLKARLKEAWELKHGTPFRIKQPPKVSVKEQWQQIVENYYRRKASSSGAVDSSGSSSSDEPAQLSEYATKL